MSTADQPAAAVDFTLNRQLCDDDGYVSDTRVAGSPNVFDPELTYLRQLNNLRAHTGLPPVDGDFHCTGSAHLAGEHIHCTSPAHRRCKHDTPGALDAPSLCWRCLTERAVNGT